MTVGVFALLVLIHGAGTHEKKSISMEEPTFYGGVMFLFHCTFHQSNRHLSQNTIGSYIHKSGDKVPHSLVPYLHMFYPGVFFLPPWRWQMLACKGIIATVAFNPQATTSSRGLRQSCLRLVWVHSSRGGGVIVRRLGHGPGGYA